MSEYEIVGNSDNEESFVPADHFDRDLYTSSQTRERALNAAIVQANISESFEEHLGIFDAFYADDIEVSSETEEEVIRGKARVRGLLCDFLIPIHIMAEIGGLQVSIRQIAMPGDAAGETHSEWTVDLVGVSGRTCTLSWRALRKWNGSRVVYEHHYDQRQIGGPLTSNDLSFSFNAAKPAPGLSGSPDVVRKFYGDRVEKSDDHNQKVVQMSNEELFVTVALNAWRSNIERANKIFGGLTANELLQQVAPGKNRLIYLWGHLTAVNDAMLPLLGLGKRLHPEFEAAFISNPDKTRASVPSAADIGNAWNDVNNKLFEGFATFSTADWLQKHGAVSAEDFAKEPHRNRFAILLGRTNHMCHHLGQLALTGVG